MVYPIPEPSIVSLVETAELQIIRQIHLFTSLQSRTSESNSRVYLLIRSNGILLLIPTRQIQALLVHLNLSLILAGVGDWASVVLLASEPPPPERKDNNSHEVDNGVIHGIRADRHDSWHNKNDGDEESPRASVSIDEEGRLSKVPWTWDKLPEDKLTHDRDAVRQVESDGTDVEDPGDGGVRAEADEVDSDAEEYAEPDRGEWGVSLGVDLSPEGGEWE